MPMYQKVQQQQQKSNLTSPDRPSPSGVIQTGFFTSGHMDNPMRLPHNLRSTAIGMIQTIGLVLLCLLALAAFLIALEYLP